AIALGGLGSWLLARYLRRVTLGYGPEELKRLFAFYDSALHSLREGLILLDGSGRLLLHHDEDETLHVQPDSDASAPIALADAPLPESVRDLLSTGRVAVDEIHLTEDRVLVISQKKASQPRGSGRDSGRSSGRGGTVATLRDRTDIQELTGELAT